MRLKIFEQCEIEVDPKQPIDELEHKSRKKGKNGTVNYLKVKTLDHRKQENC